MGLFSSSYKYYAYAASSSLFDEDERPDTIKSMIVQATVGEGIGISEAIVVGLHTDLYSRSRSMMRYAVRKYVRGLPETTTKSVHISNDDIKEAIEREVGELVDLISVRWGGDREVFFLEAAIDATYLDPTYFPWPAGDPLTDWDIRSANIELPIEDSSAPPYYMTGPDDYDFIRTSPSARIYQVTYNYTDQYGDPQTWAIPATYNLEAYDSNDWIVVKYELQSDPTTTRYWSYEIGSGVDPVLEAQIIQSSLNMQYLPVAIMMHDKVWYDEQPDEELELTTHRLLKRLAMDSYEVKEQYLEQKAEDDADESTEKSDADVWDFFIHFAVPLRSTIRGSREYLWNFWKYIRDTGTWTDFDDYQSFIAGSTGDQPISNMHITEGDADTAYHIYYRWSYIDSVIHAGRYEVDGTPLEPNRMHSEIYQFGDANYSEGIEEVHGGGTPVAATEPEGQYHDYAVFTKQLKDPVTGVYTYEQVLVMAPSMMYVINTSEDAGEPRLRYTPVELFPEDPELNSEFRVPIHIGSLKAVSRVHREEMLADALAATVFLVQEVKVKWYQQTFFKWLIIIIVIIIVVVAWQYELLPMVAAMAGAATGATALALYALYAVMVFALGFLISFAGALIGGRWGTIFVIVASLMMAGVNPFTNLAGSWAGLAGGVTWGSATAFITAVYPFMNFAMVVYQDIQMGKLQSDMRDFIKTAKEKNQELQDAWDSLGEPPSWLDPMDLIRVQSTTVIESPGNFFERMLNANPGVLGYDLISNFSEIALTLPEDGDNNMITNMFSEFEQQRGAA